MTAIPRKTDMYYRYGIPNLVTVQVDTREQYPILFPELIRVAHPELTRGSLLVAVKTERKKLDFGDYRLKKFPRHAVIERKASQLELFKNTCDPDDMVRQAKSFRKLSTGCKYPYLLIEASPGELFSTGGRVKHPDVVASRLAIAIAKYRLQLLFIPWRSRSAEVRKKMGALMIHTMLGGVLAEAYDVPPMEIEENSQDCS